MVKILQQENGTLYRCEECGLKYGEREWAEKCQAWCGQHKSCNLEIIEHAVQDRSSAKGEAKHTRRQEKEAERLARHRARSFRKAGTYALILAGVVALGYGLYLLALGSVPKGKDFSRAIPLMETTHISVGGLLPEYNSNPPTSGPHYGQTARSGFRDKEIPDQHVIHNLEHGDVWIAYHPRISDSAKKDLAQFAGAKVIITPREANDTDIALAAWGRLDTFNIDGDALSAERIGDFIKRTGNKGPEKVPGASGGI